MSATTLDGDNDGDRNGRYPVAQTLAELGETLITPSDRLHRLFEQRYAVGLFARAGGKEAFVGCAMLCSEDLDQVAFLYCDDEVDVIAPPTTNDKQPANGNKVILEATEDEDGSLVLASASEAEALKRNFKLFFSPGSQPKKLVVDVDDLNDMLGIRIQALLDTPHDEVSWLSTDDSAQEQDVTSALKRAFALAPELRRRGDAYRHRIGALAMSAADALLELDSDS